METVLRIFASRAAAELERQRATDALEALNHSVEQALQESQTLLKLVLDTLPPGHFLERSPVPVFGLQPANAG